MKTRESGREAEVIPLVAISTNSKQNRGPGDRLGLDYAATDLVQVSIPIRTSPFSGFCSMKLVE